MSDTQPQRVKLRRSTRNGGRPRVWSTNLTGPIGVGLLSVLGLIAALAAGACLAVLGALGVLAGALTGLSRLFAGASGDRDIARRS